MSDRDTHRATLEFVTIIVNYCHHGVHGMAERWGETICRATSAQCALCEMNLLQCDPPLGDRVEKWGAIYSLSYIMISTYVYTYGHIDVKYTRFKVHIAAIIAVVIRKVFQISIVSDRRRCRRRAIKWKRAKLGYSL